MDTTAQIVALVLAAVVICFLASLGVCVFIVRRTGDSKGLRDLAVVIRALGLSELMTVLKDVLRARTGPS